jgi:uncharacterized protein (DUF427 family)
LAQSDETVIVEGNHYFPPSCLNAKLFQGSQKQTTCAWKGVAHYYDVLVNGEVNEAAAWFYPSPKLEARSQPYQKLCCLLEGHKSFE